MTHDYKKALDWTNNCSDAMFSDLSVKGSIRHALTIAAEYEQLHEMLADERTENIKQFALIEQIRKERDELAARVVTLETMMREELNPLNKSDKIICRPAIDWWWLEFKSKVKKRRIAELEHEKLTKKVNENGNA